MKKVLFLGLIVSATTLASCTKYGCSCDGQPVEGQTYRENEIGANIAQLSCESSSNCNWVKAD